MLIANIGPLLTLYLCLAIICLIFRRIQVYSVLMLYLKLFYHKNMVVALFFFTFQEEYLQVVLQLSNASFGKPLTIVS